MPADKINIKKSLNNLKADIFELYKKRREPTNELGKKEITLQLEILVKAYNDLFILDMKTDKAKRN